MDKLQFKVSSALKDLVGKDLIRNENIAIFELVKNSYDAFATKVEMNSNIAHAQLKGKIPIGILLIALADMQTDEDDYKLILIKSDYDEFIAEGTGTQSSGLSIKNQIFKTCIYNIKKQDNGFTWGDITASDSTKRSASYWHTTFLELEECISDKDNTIKAFSMIKNRILNPIKKDHKPDYLVLYNATVGYMRQAGVFNLDYYKNNIRLQYRKKRQRRKIYL